MNSWKPISLIQLLEFIQNGSSKLTAAEKHFFETIRVPPEKWSLSPWGDLGGGFWVVGIIGVNILWYNDIEEGFNRSSFSKFGEIGEYTCEQDEFEWSIRLMKSYVDTGNEVRKIGLSISTE